MDSIIEGVHAIVLQKVHAMLSRLTAESPWTVVPVEIWYFNMLGVSMQLTQDADVQRKDVVPVSRRQISVDFL